MEGGEGEGRTRRKSSGQEKVSRKLEGKQNSYLIHKRAEGRGDFF